MAWTRCIGILLTACLLLNGPALAAAWAQSAQPAKAEPTAGQEVAAGFSNVFYVPGKVALCGVSGALWIVTMAMTFGTLHSEAADFVKGGCGGKWIVTGEDISSSP